jgi:hypothetical protein
VTARRTPAATLALALAAMCALGAPQPAAADASGLIRGEEVTFLVPLDAMEVAGTAVSLRFRPVPERGREARAAEAARKDRAFARAVRDYRALRRAVGLPPQPFFVSLFKDKPGVSYCTVQPILIWERPGGLPDRAELAPVIHLSESTIKRLADPAWPEVRGARRVRETLCHEAGHALMAAAYLNAQSLDLGRDRWLKLALWGASPENAIAALTGEGHHMAKRTDPPFALSEGFAEYCGAWYTGGAIRVDPAKLTPDEVRRTEGAQAALLLAVAKALPGDGQQQMLETMARHRPASLVDLLGDLAARSPEHDRAVRSALAATSDDRFRLPARYGVREYAEDFRPNALRLADIVGERARRAAEELRERFQRWRFGPAY